MSPRWLISGTALNIGGDAANMPSSRAKIRARQIQSLRLLSHTSCDHCFHGQKRGSGEPRCTFRRVQHQIVLIDPTVALHWCWSWGVRAALDVDGVAGGPGAQLQPRISPGRPHSGSGGDDRDGWVFDEGILTSDVGTESSECDPESRHDQAVQHDEAFLFRRPQFGVGVGRERCNLARRRAVPGLVAAGRVAHLDARCQGRCSLGRGHSCADAARAVVCPGMGGGTGKPSAEGVDFSALVTGGLLQRNQRHHDQPHRAGDTDGCITCAGEGLKKAGSALIQATAVIRPEGPPGSGSSSQVHERS